jgi:hypothetical protein
MGTWILVIVLLLLAGWSLWVGVVGWNLETDVVMSEHGYIAMALGIIFSLIVGIGLMALVFYSSRKGIDDEVGRQAGRPRSDPRWAEKGSDEGPSDS